jgi:hypothetical protein
MLCNQRVQICRIIALQLLPAEVYMVVAEVNSFRLVKPLWKEYLKVVMKERRNRAQSQVGKKSLFLHSTHQTED